MNEHISRSRSVDVRGHMKPDDALHAVKADPYYGVLRNDILDLVPRTSRKLLDVGCAEGETGAAAKLRCGPGAEVVGIEAHEPAAQIARNRLDRVLMGDVELLTLDVPDRYFDCILCSDVLEHTKNPWAVLESLRRVLSDDGVLIASLPNLRHIVPILKIVADRFEYEPSGILDRTHLRFFTQHTMRKLLADSGFRIKRVSANRSKSWKFTLLNILSLGLLRPFSVYQYVFVCTKKHYHSQHPPSLS